MKRKTIVSLAAFGVVFICLFNALLSVVLTDSVRKLREKYITVFAACGRFW